MMLVLMANGAGGFELAFEVAFSSFVGVATGANDDFNVFLIKYSNSSTTHATTDDDIHTLFGKEIRQKAGFVTGVGQRFGFVI